MVTRRETALQAELHDCYLDEQHIRVALPAGAGRRPCPTMAERLIARHAEVTRGQRVLVMPGGYGVLAVWAAGKTAQQLVRSFDTSLVAAEAARRTLAANRCGAVSALAALPEGDAVFDVALLTLPKGRDLARLMILAAAQALLPGGRLYLAGANDEGIQSVARDAAALLGQAEVLAYKGSNRVVLYQRPPALPHPLPPIYAAPGIAAGSYHRFEQTVAGETFVLHTRPGIFSWRELDAGTRILLEHLPVREYDHALDLGCGYGLVGLWMARRVTRGSVTLLDADMLAVDCAQRNLAENGVSGARVLLNDGLEGLERERYTLIASNPPFHSGQEVNSATTERWLKLAYARLEPRGRLVIVANRFLPYDHVLEGVFGASEVLYEDTRFRVLQAVKAYRKRGRLESEETVDEWDDEAENEAIRRARAAGQEE